MTRPTFFELRDRLSALREERSQQNEIHRPSAVEWWLEEDSGLFFDERVLATFRSPKSYVHAGTMNWPNRRARYIKWSDADGGLRRVDVDRRVPVSERLGDLHDSLKGYLVLLKLDRGLARSLPPDAHRGLSDTRVGDPFRIRLPSGRVLTEPLLRHGYYLGRLIEHLPRHLWERATVLEIGGGYGGLARVLKSYVPGLRIVLVDLLERLSLQAYYLSRSLPEAHIEVLDSLWGRERAWPDMLLVPTWRLPELPPGSIDLVLNTHSFQEMRTDQIDYYMDQIARLCEGWFYCVNRFEKQIGNETIRHPRFAYGGRFETVFERSQPRYPGILEGLYRLRNADEACSSQGCQV